MSSCPVRRAAPALDAAVFVAFVTLVAIGVATHELAHDETQAWNIARTADWPWQVPYLNRYEGHPPLWAVLLWPLTRTGNPFWLQAFSAGIAVAAVALLLRDAPFRPSVRALLPFGAYFVYHYAVLARPYGLALLIVAALAVVLRRGSGHPVAPAALCGALAATSAFGIVLSVPLALFAYAECRRRRRLASGETAAACALYLGLALAAGLSVVLPVAATEFEQTVRSGERLRPSAAWLTAALNAFPNFRTLPLGLGGFLQGVPAAYGGLLAASAVALASVGIVLRRHAHALFAWVLSIAAVAGLAAYTSTTEERYLGHLFLAALLLLWATDGSEPSPRHARPRPARATRVGTLAGAVLVATLCYHAAVGLAAIGYDAVNERTPWRRAARVVGPLLEAEDAVLINDYGYPLVPLLAWLDRPARDMYCGGCTTRFSRWGRLQRTGAAGLRAEWCALESAGASVIAITGRSRFAQVPGVESLGTWGPGQRDFRPRPALVLRLVDAAALCSDDADALLE